MISTGLYPGDDPLSLEGAGELEPVLRAVLAAGQLKQLYRQGWLQHGLPVVHCESVADHVFGVAILAMFLRDALFPHLELNRVVRMALIHDLGEVYTGDLTPQDDVDPAEKHRRERSALGRVLAGMDSAADYLALWDEYELGKSGDAQLVRQADRLEMAMQAVIYERNGLLSAGDFFASAARVVNWPELEDRLKALEQLRAPGGG